MTQTRPDTEVIFDPRTYFSEILDQLGELEPAGSSARLVSNFQQGLKRLPVRWKKATRPTAG